MASGVGMTSGALALGPDEVVPHRKFAHPDHVTSDRTTLCLLIRDIARRIRLPDVPLESWEPDRDDWYRHVIIPRPEAFAEPRTLTVVGFFGRRRAGVPLEVARSIQDLSDALDRKIPEFAGVLSYSTHLLVDELNYANLVLLESPEVIRNWRGVEPHPSATAVSKDYYDFVRIYHGSIDSAEMHREGAIRLLRVKYWDYRDEPTWTAHRELLP